MGPRSPRTPHPRGIAVAWSLFSLQRLEGIYECAIFGMVNTLLSSLRLNLTRVCILLVGRMRGNQIVK